VARVERGGPADDALRPPALVRVGEAAWLLDLGAGERVLAAYEALVRAGEPALRDVVPGAKTLLFVLDEGASGPDAARRIGDLAAAAAERGARLAPGREHEIAVRDHGEDLAHVAAHAGLPPGDVVERHARALYRVAFVGFQPGFAYLAGLPAELRVARRATPRPRVPPGSVAIGGEWTGVYPLATPGGWNLIGRTDVGLFSAEAPEPALLQPGDAVRFVAR
jgi:KipI family sensor histidine kinase inhibitor